MTERFWNLMNELKKEAIGGICPTTKKIINGHKIEASWYGGDLSDLIIDNWNVGDDPRVSEAQNIDSELCYRITEEIMEEVINLIG